MCHLALGRDAGNAKVGKQDMGAALKQHVLRLNIAVNDAFFVGVLHRVAKLREEGRGLF
jgi:hypothetical protein